MNPVPSGSIRLFRWSGITVYLHWTWFIVAYFELVNRVNQYQSPVWNVLEYLALFGIVLLHEFGHALACRQVGGTADQIMLWPLGGVAYVNPPPRPGALLWSIAAGPLVNLVLVPLTIGAFVLAAFLRWSESFPDLYHFVLSLTVLNAVLLVFNLLPVYPLDGGQILHALLWFVCGRARSLFVVSAIGVIGVGALVGLSVLLEDWWLALVALFCGWRVWIGFRTARALSTPGGELLARAQAHLLAGEFGAAIACYTDALTLMPHDSPSRAMTVMGRGIAYQTIGENDLAIGDYTEAVGLNPVLVIAYCNRGTAFKAKREYDRAITDYQEALRLDPNHATTCNNLAWLWATCPTERMRNGKAALEFAHRACDLSKGQIGNYLGTLSAAYAEVGQFDEAVRWQKKALEDPAYVRTYGGKVHQRLELYEAGKPYRDEG